MRLRDIVERERPPRAVRGETKIPWHDPGFSERMLREHLDQRHDRASRREQLIERQVTSIHAELLGRSSRVLDLGCGPGLYTSRLSRLGHECTGIDLGTASIAYARDRASESGDGTRYVLGDVLEIEYGGGYDLVMMLFGEINAFSPDEAAELLRRARAVLAPGGRVLLEAHRPGSIRGDGADGSSWSAEPAGLFSDRPHLLLHEHHWDAEERTRVSRFYLVDAETAEVTRFGERLQGYDDAGYAALLARAGLAIERLAPSLVGSPEGDETFIAIVAAPV